METYERFGLKWTTQYSNHSAIVYRDLAITVNWMILSKEDLTKERFKVSFAGTTLKQRFADLDEAQRAGIRLAKRVIEEAAKVLGIAEMEIIRAEAAEADEKERIV